MSHPASLERRTLVVPSYSPPPPPGKVLERSLISKITNFFSRTIPYLISKFAYSCTNNKEFDVKFNAQQIVKTQNNMPKISVLNRDSTQYRAEYQELTFDLDFDLGG